MLSQKTRAVLAALAVFAASPALADKAEVLTPTAVPSAEAPADAVVVTIDKMKYGPAEVTIKAGQTVTWINAEAMPHNVAFQAGVISEAKLDGAMMKKDQSFSMTFAETGTYDYHCTPHPFMKGKVVVE